MSLSDYLLNEIRVVGERPTVEELRARLRTRSSITPSICVPNATPEDRGRRLGGDRA